MWGRRGWIQAPPRTSASPSLPMRQIGAIVPEIPLVKKPIIRKVSPTVPAPSPAPSLRMAATLSALLIGLPVAVGTAQNDVFPGDRSPIFRTIPLEPAPDTRPPTVYEPSVSQPPKAIPVPQGGSRSSRGGNIWRNEPNIWNRNQAPAPVYPQDSGVSRAYPPRPPMPSSPEFQPRPGLPDSRYPVGPQTGEGTAIPLPPPAIRPGEEFPSVYPPITDESSASVPLPDPPPVFGPPPSPSPPLAQAPTGPTMPPSDTAPIFRRSRVPESIPAPASVPARENDPAPPPRLEPAPNPVPPANSPPSAPESLAPIFRPTPPPSVGREEPVLAPAPAPGRNSSGTSSPGSGGTPARTELPPVPSVPEEDFSGLPFAKPVVGKVGFVTLPDYSGEIDVRGIAPGTPVEIPDPKDESKTIQFRVP